MINEKNLRMTHEVVCREVSCQLMHRFALYVPLILMFLRQKIMNFHIRSIENMSLKIYQVQFLSTKFDLCTGR